MSNENKSLQTKASVPTVIAPREVDDGERVVHRVSLGSAQAETRARDMAKSATAALRGEIRNVVRAQRYAALVAEGLLLTSEIPEKGPLTPRQETLIELRRRGLADLPAGGSGESQ